MWLKIYDGGVTGTPRDECSTQVTLRALDDVVAQRGLPIKCVRALSNGALAIAWLRRVRGPAIGPNRTIVRCGPTALDRVGRRSIGCGGVRWKGRQHGAGEKRAIRICARGRDGPGGVVWEVAQSGQASRSAPLARHRGEFDPAAAAGRGTVSRRGRRRWQPPGVGSLLWPGGSGRADRPLGGGRGRQQQARAPRRGE